jgi:hypothetical protein
LLGLLTSLHHDLLCLQVSWSSLQLFWSRSWHACSKYILEHSIYATLQWHFPLLSSFFQVQDAKGVFVLTLNPKPLSNSQLDSPFDLKTHKSRS